MSKQIRPLLSRYEKTLPATGAGRGILPGDGVTSEDKIYKSTLLIPDAAAASISDFTRYTRVEAETTDDN